MRVVFAHEFDPAGVHIGYRTALKAVPNVEVFVLSQLTYIHRSDFDKPEVALSAPPDVIVVCPGVGQGSGDWAAGIGSPTEYIGKLPPWVEDILQRFPAAKRVALFHGSPHTERFRDAYAAHWRARGFAIAATTLDYATEMEAAWLPPYADVGGLRAVPFDPARDLLAIIQTPSVPDLCHTTAFIAAARPAGAIPIVANHLAHHQCLWLKSRFPAGFDHLRGSFSVNTLENAAMGMVPLFFLERPYLARMKAEGVEAAPLTLTRAKLTQRKEDLLRDAITQLVTHASRVREYQQWSRQWWEKHFSREKIATRLVKFFRSL